jgi:NADH-quinone oxidoreductase subunit J
MNIEIKEIVFIIIVLLTILPCSLVAFSRNILYSAFALFFTFLGTSGLYFFLDADFLAIVQLAVYIGGILILLLFAILLTKNIDDIKKTNAISFRRSVAAGITVLVLFFSLLFVFLSTGWAPLSDSSAYPNGTIHELGRLILSKYLLPFEIASLLLLAVLIGSLVIAGRTVRQGEN